jgi:hypothetical protein
MPAQWSRATNRLKSVIDTIAGDPHDRLHHVFATRVHQMGGVKATGKVHFGIEAVDGDHAQRIRQRCTLHDVQGRSFQGQ